jgi:hypothetical protein
MLFRKVLKQGSKLCIASVAMQLAIFASVLFSASTACKAQSQTEPKHDSEHIRHFTLKLVTLDGTPVPSAIVNPNGIFCSEDNGTVGYQWPIEPGAHEPEWKSNANGLVEVELPIQFQYDNQWRTPKQFIFRVRHRQFVEKIFLHDAFAANAIVELTPGCEVAVSVRDPFGKRSTAFAIMPLRVGGGPIWVDTQDNQKITRSLPPGVFPCLIVSPQDDGVTLFAGAFPVIARPDRKFSLRDIPLQPGVVVTGKLPSHVPRPILDGRVFVECSPNLIGYGGQDVVQRTGFRDWSSIDRDGNFVFRSLPATGTLQVIALCRGWISSGRKDGRVSGDLFQLDELHVSNNIVSIVPEMHQAGSLGITLIQPDGSPIASSSVYVAPNVYWNHRGQTSILGLEFSDLAWIRNKQEADSYFTDRLINHSPTRLRQSTDDQGFAVLEDLPIDMPLEVYMKSSDFALPVVPGQTERMVPFILKNPGQTDITLNAEQTNRK